MSAVPRLKSPSVQLYAASEEILKRGKSEGKKIERETGRSGGEGKEGKKEGKETRKEKGGKMGRRGRKERGRPAGRLNRRLGEQEGGPSCPWMSGD